MNRPWTFGKILAGFYGALVVLSVGYLIYRIHWEPAGSEFAGLPLIVLASPWSLWTTQGLHATGFNFDLSPYLNIALLLPGAALNAWLIDRLGRLLDPPSR